MGNAVEGFQCHHQEGEIDAVAVVRLEPERMSGPPVEFVMAGSGRQHVLQSY